MWFYLFVLYFCGICAFSSSCKFRVVIFTDVSGQRIGPIFKSQEVQEGTFWLLKMGPIFCPDTSVKDYHSTLCNIPEERRCQVIIGLPYL
jgi:hypothetical protein